MDVEHAGAGEASAAGVLKQNVADCRAVGCCLDIGKHDVVGVIPNLHLIHGGIFLDRNDEHAGGGFVDLAFLDVKILRGERDGPDDVGHRV